MGFDRESCEFLIHAHKQVGAFRGKVLTLGRQQMFASPAEVRTLAAKKGLTLADDVSWTPGSGYCEALFKALGAASVDSMDASDYESATLIHDLNAPVATDLHERFDCVVDGGTIEHVFHFPNAIRSCMRMIAPGGHYLAITPANNQMGHGFYQFSPELYFRIFSPENGFMVRTMLLRTHKEWFEVSDPKKVGNRGAPLSSVPLMLAIVAQRTGPTDVFHTPQQSDYADAWSLVDSLRNDSKREGESTLRHTMRKYVPLPVRTLLRRLRAGVQPKVDAEGMTHVDAAHFKRVDL